MARIALGGCPAGYEGSLYFVFSSGGNDYYTHRCWRGRNPFRIYMTDVTSIRG